MENKFKYSNDNKRYHTWNYHLQQKFGGKVFKVALNGGFTCPNIDGKRASEGVYIVRQAAAVILPVIRHIIFLRSLRKSRSVCIKSGTRLSIFRIFRHIQIHMHLQACCVKGLNPC